MSMGFARTRRAKSSSRTQRPKMRTLGPVFQAVKSRGRLRGAPFPGGIRRPGRHRTNVGVDVQLQQRRRAREDLGHVCIREQVAPRGDGRNRAFPDGRAS
jgi:hypothetical protein